MSLPTRERGLKLGDQALLIDIDAVAPHAGAWIETFWLPAHRAMTGVAPHAGAWIETGSDIESGFEPIVAPHAGAWIET